MTAKNRKELKPNQNAHANEILKQDSHNKNVQKAIDKAVGIMNQGKSWTTSKDYIYTFESNLYMDYQVERLLESADDFRLFGVIKEPSLKKFIGFKDGKYYNKNPKINQMIIRLHEAPKQEYKYGKRWFGYGDHYVWPFINFDVLLATLPYLKTKSESSVIPVRWDPIVNGLIIKFPKIGSYGIDQMESKIEQMIMNRLIDNDLVKVVETKRQNIKKYYGRLLFLW